MSSIDVAFKWAVTLKIIKDLNKNGDLIYSDKLLANDLGTSYKSVNRWIKQTAGNPRLNNYEVKLKDSFGISLNTILQAETIKELVLGLSKDMADNRFDGKKVEFYVNLFAANEMHQTTTNVNTPQQITEKENPPEQQNINHYFLKAPSDSLHLNELSLGDKHAITQYYKGVVSNWVPIQANVPIPSYISSDETYHNYPQKLDLAMQLNLFTQEKLPSLVRIHGPAGSGKTTSALELSHQLSKKGEHCLLRTNEQGNINFDDIAKLCEELVSTQQRLFLFYDSPSQKQYLELGMLITEVIKASIDNLTVVVFDSEKNWRNFFSHKVNMNTYIFHIDETTYDENLLDLYCEKISSLEMFDIPILSPTQTIEAYKKRLKSKRVKLPVVMAFELTKSKAIIQTLWNESSNIRSDNAKQIYLFTILLNKRDIWISDEFYSSIYDTIHYKNIVDQHLLGLLVPAKGALYVRDKPIAKILISHIFSCFEEEIRFIRDYLKQNLELVKTDRTKTQMSRQLSEIAYRLMANTRNAEIIVEYIGDIFHSIERFINVPDFRAMLYNKVATFLIANGKEKQGIEIYYLGIKNVESDHFYMQLARFYLHEKNNEEKALKYLKNCIKKGTNAIVITEYCKQLVDVGSINKALKIYRKTVNEFPDDPGIFTSYAMLLSRENRIEEALSVFQQGSLGKPDTQLYTAWIKTLLKAKQEQLALEIFYEAKANIEPESGIYTIVASYYFRHNKLMLAESMCEEGLRFNPTAHHIAITCRVLRRLQKTDRAHEVLNKYTKHNDTYLITERFLLHYDLQQYSLCLQTILTTKINVLKDTDYLYFANKLYKQKQYQQVVLICQKALELQKRPRLFLLCAQALEAQDKPLRAIECMIEGLCLDDKNESILRALSTSFTDKNTATVIDMLKHRLNLKSLLYNSAFVTLLISTQAKHNCLPTIYNKIKILLNDEMRNLFKAELTSENDAKSAK